MLARVIEFFIEKVECGGIVWDWGRIVLAILLAGAAAYIAFR